MKSTTCQSRGYVLVATLALLILGGTLLAAFARSAMSRAALASRMHEELQRRMAIASLKRAVMPYTDSILTAMEAKNSRPYPAYRTTLKLGRVEFDLVLSDEQAKANINALLADAPAPQIESRLREALAGSGLGAKVRLRPDPSSRPPPATRPARRTLPRITGFGQVFDDLPPEGLLMRRGEVPPAASILTCWGSGVLNIKRAPEASIRIFAGTALTNIEINQILETRQGLFDERRDKRTDPSAGSPLQQTMRAVLASPGTPGTGVKSLAWTESSECHSLWIVARDGTRSWYHLLIHDTGAMPDFRQFSW